MAKTYGIYRNGKLLEGGFFDKEAALDTAAEYPGSTVRAQGSRTPAQNTTDSDHFEARNVLPTGNPAGQPSERTPESADLELRYEGSISWLLACNEHAQRWIEDHLPEDALSWGNGVVIEHRYVELWLTEALNTGFKVQIYRAGGAKGALLYSGGQEGI